MTGIDGVFTTAIAITTTTTTTHLYIPITIISTNPPVN
jgi:hypothetical protein